jgi:uncharacterized protein (TIGR02996 family)
MDAEDGFLVAIAEDPADLVTHLVYADWLDEGGQEFAATCLRTWCQLVSVPYSEATYRLLQSRLEEYRSQLRVADPPWVQRVAKARAWVNVSLAENVARLQLRTRHGRKADRQWIDPPRLSIFKKDVWEVYFWRNPPARRKANPWHGKSCMRVDQITAEVQEPV